MAARPARLHGRDSGKAVSRCNPRPGRRPQCTTREPYRSARGLDSVIAKSTGKGPLATVISPQRRDATRIWERVRRERCIQYGRRLRRCGSRPAALLLCRCRRGPGFFRNNYRNSATLSVDDTICRLPTLIIRPASRCFDDAFEYGVCVSAWSRRPYLNVLARDKVSGDSEGLLKLPEDAKAFAGDRPSSLPGARTEQQK